MNSVESVKSGKDPDIDTVESVKSGKKSGKDKKGKKQPVIRILVAAHKRAYAPPNRLIRLVQAGSALAEEHLPGMLHDDVGDHISDRNRTYCELTVQYFAWKNLEADYYGFFHYRRYMSFAKEYPVAAGSYGNPMDLPGRKAQERGLSGRQLQERGLFGRQLQGKGLDGKPFVRPYLEADSLRGDLSDYALEETHIRAVVEKYDVLTVLPERMNVTVYQHFCQFHDRADLDRMIRILKTRRPEYAAACDRYMGSRSIYFCNMYIMRREYFRAYMEWLFPLLEEFEAGKDFGGCKAKQMRVTGYLAERLFGVYYTRLREQGNVRCCELQYVIFHRNIRRFRLWRHGPQIAVDMKKVNGLFPPGSLQRRILRTLAGRPWLNT